jgi:hypothetical protein
MGLYLDGRASVVVGSHTHVPTADGEILPKGTGYLTDAGMTGPYSGVIGMRYEDSYAKAYPFDGLVSGMLSERMLDEAAAIMRRAVALERHVTVIVNNRAGGNAPLIAERSWRPGGRHGRAPVGQRRGRHRVAKIARTSSSTHRPPAVGVATASPPARTFAQ